MEKATLNDLFQTLKRLNRQMHRAFHREGQKNGGLYHGQGSLLLLILQNEGVSQRDLAEQLDVRPSSMTEMLSRLEQSDLIKKKQDEKDQRIMRISLTEKGREAAQKIEESKDSFIESFFIGLTEEDQQQLLVLTQKLCKKLEKDEFSFEHDMEHIGSGIHPHPHA